MSSDEVNTDALDRDGWTVLPDLLDPAALDAVRVEVAEALTEARDDGPTGTAHAQPYGEAVAAMLDAPALRAAVEHVLGPDAEARECALRAPNPGYGAQALHADFGGPPPAEGPQVAVAMVALVDVTETGGATRVVSGTHTWRKIAPGDTIDRAFPGEARVPLTAGSALVFNGHLWHSGTRNDGPTRRDALQLTFTRPDTARFGT